MTIRSTQKLIKIGSSAGVTVPAKELKSAGLKVGDEVDFILKPRKTAVTKDLKDLDAEYEAFKKQYGTTLKNLADR